MDPSPSPASPGSVPGPEAGHDWLALSGTPLPVDAVSRWVVRPDCGAVVVFTGVVRDHAEGRSDVTELTYEAYEEYAVARMADVVADARRQFPALGRIAVLHRVGRLDVGDPAVVVAVSAPHRGEAFDGARYCIDTVKAMVPIWKHERWGGGVGWGTNASPLDAGAGPNGPHDRADPHGNRPGQPSGLTS